MATNSRDIRDADQRNEEHGRSLGAMQAANVNEDGSVSDFHAKERAEKAAENSAVPPNQRVADSDAVGTPAWVEANTPSHLHSDGGPGTAPEASSVRALAGVSEEEIKRQDKQIEDGVKAAEDERKKAKDNQKKLEAEDKKDKAEAKVESKTPDKK